MATKRTHAGRAFRSRGQVILLIAMLSTLLIALAGLAVDLVLAYAVKTFLATATDAAAMGGVSWTEAAQAWGFADSAHLTRTCRRMFGIAPSMLVRSSPAATGDAA